VTLQNRRAEVKVAIKTNPFVSQHRSDRPRYERSSKGNPGAKSKNYGALVEYLRGGVMKVEDGRK